MSGVLRLYCVLGFSLTLFRNTLHNGKYVISITAKFSRNAFTAEIQENAGYLATKMSNNRTFLLFLI